MITLCGFSVSNYYNKVKMVLLEKDIPFTEEYYRTDLASEAVRASSPLGKVPFIRTAAGALCESEVIVEYLEDLQPEPCLLPKDPWERAKVRELVTFIELHLELVARELYGAAFSRAEISDADKSRVLSQLQRNSVAFVRIAKFSPYVAGEEFTLADCAAFVSLPVIAMASKLVYGMDVLEDAGIDWKAYARTVGQRPSAQRVTADRQAELAAQRAQSN